MRKNKYILHILGQDNNAQLWLSVICCTVFLWKNTFFVLLSYPYLMSQMLLSLWSGAKAMRKTTGSALSEWVV